MGDVEPLKNVKYRVRLEASDTQATILPIGLVPLIPAISPGRLWSSKR